MNSRFVTVDAGDSVASAARLAEVLAVDQVVVDAGGETFFVFSAAQVAPFRDEGAEVTVADALGLGRASPVAVVGPDLVGARRDETAPLVVVDEGVVLDLVVPTLLDSARRSLRIERALEAPAVAVRGSSARTEVATAGGDAEPAKAEAGGATAAGREEAGPVATAVIVDYPATVSLDETLSLLIALGSDTSATRAIPIAARTGDHIDVVVSPRANFVVEGKAEGQLRVTGERESLPIQIKLRATALGRGRITVFVFRDGGGLGSLTVTPEVIPPGESTGARSMASTALSVVQASEADLELIILEQRDAAGRPVLQYRLSARDRQLALNLKPFGPVPLETGPGPFFTDLYKEIEALPVGTDAEKALATKRLHNLGSSLFTQLFPEDLQALLWGLKDRIDTVWVQSDEPWVPWEICRLQGREDGRVVEGQFFCEAFKLTRWVPGAGTTTELTLSKIGVIAPPDSQLESGPKEVAMLKELASSVRTVTTVDADFLGVLQAFSAATFDGIHFVGHGRFPDQANPTKAEIALREDQKLRPTDISGEAANMGLTKPLVFFNACQAGRQSKSLTGVGGWASALVKAGVGAFVGAHWDVTDDLALDFATTFYEQLLAGEPIGAAAKTARLKIRSTGDPTWLAYTVFAEPLARVTT